MKKILFYLPASKLVRISAGLFISLFITAMSVSGQAPPIQWQKCLGGSSHESPGWGTSQLTPDGGYIVVGLTPSNNGDVSGNHGDEDIWVVKLTSTGAIQWQRCLGGSSLEWANSIQLTPDGGYIVAGVTESYDGDVSGNHGSGDIWVVKLTSTGAIQWQKCLGGSGGDGFYYASTYPIHIQLRPDGGYIVAGATYSNDGDVSGWHVGYNYNGYPTTDIWVVKLSSTGTIEWQKCLGGSGYDGCYFYDEVDDIYDAVFFNLSIHPTPDGGYIVSGLTASNNGDVSGWHPDYWINGQPIHDSWVVKLSSTGTIQWQKCLGGSSTEDLYIKLTPDGGYIISGQTWSNDGDVSGNHGENDFWVVKLTSTGAIQWQKCLGGSGYEFFYGFQLTPDGGYIVEGYTYSNDGDVSGNHGGYDIWVVKLGNGPVPIKLTSIAARNQGNVNIINWSSASEDPGERYELQRSADGVRFSTIASLPGNGRAADYEYTDTDPIAGVNYYRLLLINNNGNNTFSKIVSAFVKNGIELRLSPNPASEVLNIQIRGSVVNKATLQITDVTGKTVLLSNLINNKPTKINISMLATGVYFLRYRDDQHEIVKKFVVN